MGPQKTAFISCRFHKEDKKIVDWFDEKIQSFGLATYKAEFPTKEPSDKKVLRNIQTRDILCAIVTKTYSPWIQNEIGMAYAMGKPIIAFFEEGNPIEGLYPYVADYVKFNRENLEGSTNDVIHIVNQVVKELDSQKTFDHEAFCQLQLYTQKQIDEILPQKIKRSNKIDTFLYTAETFLNGKCHEALQYNPDLKLRLLIRNPQNDKRKYPLAMASINFIQQLNNPNIEIRCYNDAPLLRAIVFDKSCGYLGLYRWDPHAHFRFIGAENNSLAYVTKDNRASKLWLDLWLSRFNYEWQRCEKFY
jgi:nucleoside 2-deoxyribosyltransferase